MATEPRRSEPERVHPAASQRERLVRRLRVDFFRAVAAANVLGVVVVAGFLTLVVPVPADYGGDQILLINLALLGYVLVAIPVGVAWGRRLARPVLTWLREDRPPTNVEQHRALEWPWLGFRILGPLWLGGAILVGTLNASISTPGYGALLGFAVALGGITTCAVIALWAERTLREMLAAALESGVPREPVGPGVSARVVLAWAPATGIPLFGIVLIATAVLFGTELSAERLAVTAVFLGSLGLGIGLLAIWIAGRSIADPVEAVRAELSEVERGNLSAEVEVSQGSEVGLLAAGFNRMVEGLRERERIRKAFGTYVDREVAEHILREGTALEGEEVEVTMLFLDIRGFTTFAERLSAPEVVTTLNRLFERIVPIIHAHGGHVDKYVGDGLLAVFGAPRRQADHADHALAAGLEIAGAVEDEFGEELSVGVGLNSGVVVAGNVGGAGRLEFSVIGDAVNVAARVESATRQTGDGVLVAERTKELLKDPRIQFVERPGLTLKGKTKPVAIYSPVVPNVSGVRAD